MDRKTVEAIVEKARSLKLMGLDFLNKCDIEKICREYNGIGPQFLKEKLRNKVTKMLAIFEPSAMIHDLRFGSSDGTRESFDYANCEFFVNCHKCAKDAYKWWNWKRYLAYAVIDAMNEFNCSDMGGWRAWVEAHEKNKAA